MLLSFLRQMGWRYTMYRIMLLLKQRSGWLLWQFPRSPKKRTWISLDTWRAGAPAFLWNRRSDLAFAGEYRPEPEALARMHAGDVLFFSRAWKKLGTDYDWVSNPLSGYRSPAGTHWSKVPHFSPESGDIKYIWEKSRFGWIGALLRHDLHSGEDHSEWVFSEIASWLRANAVNTGPNYACSQEISLRCMHWIMALYFYRDCRSLTPELFDDIQHALYWQIRHVYGYIDFSRIAVRNNHALTETLLLYSVGLLFPFFPEAAHWKRDGKRWFEEEVAYQIREDGTFLQYSMNYHRVVVQILCWGLALAARHGEGFSQTVLERAYRSVDFLLQCQDLSSGFLPNYGSNDGAWFFQLSATDFRDFRPSLNALHRLLTGAPLYDGAGAWQEEGDWWGQSVAAFPALSQRMGVTRFDDDGYYLWREAHTFTFLRCGKHRNRPLQADNLHLDLWHKGRNILFDAGSYLYNTDAENTRYFMGTAGHNSVMLGDYDQMEKRSRFIWQHWTQAIEVEIRETPADWIIEGRIRAFEHVRPGIVHERRVTKRKGVPVWIVQDTLIGAPADLPMVQRWHTDCPEALEIRSLSGAEKSEKQGWQSLYYGEKTTCTQILFETPARSITTQIRVL